MSRHRKQNSYHESSAKSPEYISVARRRSTFVGWPHEQGLQCARNMAVAGFFHLGPADRAKCFYCGIVLRDWESDDDPFNVHRQWSPNCGYINHITEQQISSGVGAMHLSNSCHGDASDYNGNRSRHPPTCITAETCVDGDPAVHDAGYNSSDTSPVSESPREYARGNVLIYNRSTSTPPGTTWEHPPHVQAVLEMGYTLEDIHRASRQRRETGGEEFTDAPSLMCAIEKWD